MLTFLKRWWHNGEVRKSHNQNLELTVTRLMVSMMHMDDKLEQSEHDEIIRLLRKRFSLYEDEAENLFQEAIKANGEGPGFEALAAQIKRNYNKLDVAVLISDIWRVAEAGGRIDFYEERYISRISSLLKVPTEMVREAKYHRMVA
ncbi:MAG: TerB family tellurite resistance protein [Mariprofundaceae bacterium]|nr:TerB family tellurite resistance protein [Mariprofundaceae bacterium]